MNLILDIGNSRAKIALIDDEKILNQWQFSTTDHEAIRHTIIGQSTVNKAILSNVGSDFDLPPLSYPILKLNHEVRLPFESKYSTPTTLGIDRIALVAAAVSNHPGNNCLIIDAGTCITYDFIDEAGIYHGGGISPGLNMRLNGLADYTARLPKVEFEKEFELIGGSTRESILSGAAGGFKREVEATIDAYKSRYPSLITVITGGDGIVFDYLAKNSIFAAPDFLLTGLNHILEYNAERL